MSLGSDAKSAFEAVSPLGPAFLTLDQQAARNTVTDTGSQPISSLRTVVGGSPAVSDGSEGASFRAAAVGKRDCDDEVAARTSLAAATERPRHVASFSSRQHGSGRAPAAAVLHVKQAAAGTREAKDHMEDVLENSAALTQLTSIDKFLTAKRAELLRKQASFEAAVRSLDGLASPASYVQSSSPAPAAAKKAVDVLLAISEYAACAASLSNIQLDTDVVASMRKAVEAQRLTLRAGIELAEATEQACLVFQQIVDAPAGRGAGAGSAADSVLGVTSGLGAVSISRDVFESVQSLSQAAGTTAGDSSSGSEFATSLTAAVESALVKVSDMRDSTRCGRELHMEAREKLEEAARRLCRALSVAKSSKDSQRVTEAAYVAVCTEASEARLKKLEGGIPLSQWEQLAAALRDSARASDFSKLSAMPLVAVEAYGRIVVQRLAARPASAGDT